MPVQEWSTFLAGLRSGAVPDSGGTPLPRALALGHDIAPRTLGVSLTQVADDGFDTPAASDDLALELDEAQYVDHDGPCVIAARDRERQRIDAMAAESRFPRFVATALRHGVRSSLSVPVPGLEVRTALNLYSAAESAFVSDRAQRRADLLARVISASVTRPDPSAGVSGEVEKAEQHGQRVADAIALLMGRLDVDEAGAFAVLVGHSRAEQAPLLTVAERVLRTGGDPA